MARVISRWATAVSGEEESFVGGVGFVEDVVAVVEVVELLG